MPLSTHSRQVLASSLADLAAAAEMAAGHDTAVSPDPSFTTVTTTGAAVFGSSVTVATTLGVTGAATFTAAVTVGTTLGVTGAATFTAAATVGTTLGVTGAATFTAAVTVGTTLGVTGIATFSNDVKIASGHGLYVNNVKVVGTQQTAVTPVAVTFSANTPSTYGSPVGTLTISDGATPTVVELVKYCNELRKNIVDLQAVLHTHGLTT